MLGRHLPLIAAILTSVAAVWIGVTRLDLHLRSVRTAVLWLLDCVWTALVFFTANVLGGVALIAAGRVLGGEPVSSYSASDLMLVVVSLVQGVAFQLWRHTGRRTP